MKRENDFVKLQSAKNYVNSSGVDELQGNTASIVAIVCGVLLIIINWFFRMHDGHFYLAPSFIAPIAVVFGIINFFTDLPADSKEAIKSLKWWAFILVGLFSGYLNFYLLSHL